jgi:predicted nucleic acid-binding protein
MVLVDTSVWIRFLSNAAPFAADLDRLLDADEVIGHDLVAGELQIGDRGGRVALLDAYAQMSHSKTVAHSDVVELVRARKLAGLGLGWIDAHLLAAALLQGHHIWTADTRFATVAIRLGVGYQPAASRER